MKVESKITQTVNSNGLYILLGGVYYIYSIAYLPVKVEILELDIKKAKIEQGWIGIDRLYRTEEDCPQR